MNKRELIILILFIIILISCVAISLYLKFTSNNDTIFIDKRSQEALLYRVKKFYEAQLNNEYAKIYDYYDRDFVVISKDEFVKNRKKLDGLGDKISRVFRKKKRADDEATFKIIDYSNDKAQVLISSREQATIIGFSDWIEEWIFNNGNWYYNGFKPAGDHHSADS